MSRIYQTGAETQNTLEVTSPAGLAISTTKKTGKGSAASYAIGRSYNNGTATTITMTANTSSMCYIKQDLYIETLPDVGSDDLFIRTVGLVGLYNSAASVNDVRIYNDGGTLKVILNINFEGSTAQTYTIANLGVDFNTWFRFEAFFNSSPADDSEVFEIRINGVPIINRTDLNFHVKTFTSVTLQAVNISGAGPYDILFYADNISINDSAGSINNSWIGEEYIAALSPTGAGSSNPTAGDYTSINEIPFTNTSTGSADRIELDTNTTEAWFTITPALNSFDIVNAITVPILIKEETSTVTSYQVGIKSATAGTPQKSTAADSGNTTVSYKNQLISETDPTTTSRWTVTGTNSLTNAQIGVLSLDPDDIWVTAMAAMVAYTPGQEPRNSGLLQMLW